MHMNMCMHMCSCVQHLPRLEARVGGARAREREQRRLGLLREGRRRPREQHDAGARLYMHTCICSTTPALGCRTLGGVCIYMPPAHAHAAVRVHLPVCAHVRRASLPNAATFKKTCDGM